MLVINIFVLNFFFQNLFFTFITEIFFSKFTSDIWMVTGGTWKITVCSSTFYGIDSKNYCWHLKTLGNSQWLVKKKVYQLTSVTSNVN